MDGEVGAAFAQRGLELLDEQALAADRRERPVEHAIALRRDAEQVDARAADSCAVELRANVLGLPSASADSRVAIVSRRGAKGAVIACGDAPRGRNRPNSRRRANDGGGGHISRSPGFVPVAQPGARFVLRRRCYR